MSKIKVSKRILFAAAILIILSSGAAAFLNYAYVPPVIMYHSIDDNDMITKLSVSPEGFEKQMKFLKDHHYNVITLEEMAGYIRKGRRPPYKSIAVTFDDGFYNNYEHAYPVLKKYGIPATIFVITGKIGQDGWLNWREIKEMSDSPFVTIGSHTVTHSWLTMEDAEELRKELVDSKAVLEKNLARPVNTLCYPMGVYDERAKQAVKDAGYTCAVVTSPGRGRSSGDVYSIRRIKISRTSYNLFVFWFETSGYYSWFKGLKK